MPEANRSGGPTELSRPSDPQDRARSRLMSEADTARLLKMSPSAFSRKAPRLEQQLGMPPRHPGLKRRDSVAIHAWLNRLFGVSEKQTNVSDLVRQRMGALQDGNRAD